MRFSKTKTGILFLLICYLIIPNSSIAQSSRFSVNQYINNGDTLCYRLLYPDYDTMRKYPLVIFLHGSGERGNDNEAQLKWGSYEFCHRPEYGITSCNCDSSTMH